MNTLQNKQVLPLMLPLATPCHSPQEESSGRVSPSKPKENYTQPRSLSLGSEGKITLFCSDSIVVCTGDDEGFRGLAWFYFLFFNMILSIAGLIWLLFTSFGLVLSIIPIQNLQVTFRNLISLSYQSVINLHLRMIQDCPPKSSITRLVLVLLFLPIMSIGMTIVSFFMAFSHLYSAILEEPDHDEVNQIKRIWRNCLLFWLERNQNDATESTA